MRSPFALNARRAASAFTVTQEASTCSCTGKSGQSRRRLRADLAPTAASAETNRFISLTDSMPVAYSSASRDGARPPVTRVHSPTSRSYASSGPAR